MWQVDSAAEFCRVTRTQNTRNKEAENKAGGVTQFPPTETIKVHTANSPTFERASESISENKQETRTIW